MTIFVGSRYEFDPVDRVQHSDGEFYAAVFRTPGPTLLEFTFRTHIVEEGDRLDTLAAFFYNDSELWWLICEGNPELFDFDPLIPGTVLRIPYASSRS